MDSGDPESYGPELCYHRKKITWLVPVLLELFFLPIHLLQWNFQLYIFSKHVRKRWPAEEYIGNYPDKLRGPEPEMQMRQHVIAWFLSGGGGGYHTFLRLTKQNHYGQIAVKPIFIPAA